MGKNASCRKRRVVRSVIWTALFILFVLRVSPAQAGAQGGFEILPDNTVDGWVCSKADLLESNRIIIFVGDPERGGQPIGAASTRRIEDTERVHNCQDGVALQFRHNIDRSTRSRLGPGKHSIYVRVTGLKDPRTSEVLQVVRVLNVKGTKIPLNLGANFNTACTHFSSQDWRPIRVEQSGCEHRYSWNIRGTNEDASFGSPKFFLPEDPLLNGTPYRSAERPYWTYRFERKPGNNYRLLWVLDKVSVDLDRNQYSGAFLNDSGFTKPLYLSANLFVDITAKLNGSNAELDIHTGQAKIRTSIGAVSRWKDRLGRAYDAFVEVNIFRTANFDLCTATTNVDKQPKLGCDPDELYDRRAYYGSGEIVYYDIASMASVAGISQERLRGSGVAQIYTIPIAELFRRYPWQRPPGRWQDATISGLYLGHEIWGKGYLSVEFEDYLVYEFIAE